ncbi:MAG TPA: restriction endonuclease [Stellaceae bacterium]|nr:restriction endonuclease [Stellaceae bacterium]
MAVPAFQTFLLPVLRFSAAEISNSELVVKIADELRLSDDDRTALLPSGRQSRLANRVHWAKAYLSKAGLVATPRRGLTEITLSGKELLANPPERLDLAYLMSHYPAIKEFRQRTGKPDQDEVKALEVASTAGVTPDEAMRTAYVQLEDELAAELLQRILAAPPSFFERLVVQLVIAMGYGGSIEEAGRALGKSGDGGVDGVIDQDALGLDRIYLQAKRYADGTVGPGAIRDFFGALDNYKAAKGIFITTSRFSEAATETAERLSKRIVLMDGRLLTQLMIRYGVGCRIEETLHIKKIDEDFFE